MDLHLNEYMFACMYIYVYVYIFIYIYIYVYMVILYYIFFCWYLLIRFHDIKFPTKLNVCNLAK